MATNAPLMLALPQSNSTSNSNSSNNLGLKNSPQAISSIFDYIQHLTAAVAALAAATSTDVKGNLMGCSSVANSLLSTAAASGSNVSRMEDYLVSQQTELPGGHNLSNHRSTHHLLRFAPYALHRPQLQSAPISQQPSLYLPVSLHHNNGSSSSGNPSYSHHLSHHPHLHSHHHHHHHHHHQKIGSPKRSNSPSVIEGTHIGHLYPEILEMIFEKLSVRDRGRAAQVCTSWRDAAYSKSVWKGVEAKLHLKRSSPNLFPSLVKRGIKKVQILSLRRTLKDVVVNVPQLTELNLSGCYNVTDMNLGHAFSIDLPNLKVLDLSLCKQITDSSLGRIAQYLKNLETLELGGCCNITNTGLLLIAWGLKKLKHLNLRSCWHISDQGIGHLAGLSKKTAEGNLALESLGLQDCQRLSDEALGHIAQGLTSLKVINLSFCVSVTDSGLKHLAKMPELQELNLRSCDNISDIGMAYLTEGCTGLTCLDVSFCDKITDHALAHIANGLDNLKSLSLNQCQITDEGIEKIAKSLRDLEVLNIGQCIRITDNGLKFLVESSSGKSLKSIDLYGCTQLSSNGLDCIMKLPKLSKLNLGLWVVR
ncbi:F-box/LRR-repeat protein 14 [Condylostylus longicornis]|uniref:F-box/LRR-repeat protein 14 n=1 Tax=Condylostylus longicornis TaxID=2530218 RepID=UPI00244E5B3E|nr:F-box/LRR-repeat protein 14 [Condylostylus longicornis]